MSQVKSLFTKNQIRSRLPAMSHHPLPTTKLLFSLSFTCDSLSQPPCHYKYQTSQYSLRCKRDKEVELKIQSFSLSRALVPC
jgi:hypothetical protein